MSKFNPEKLSTTYMDVTTDMQPIISRRYTLTHSDETGELFLHIGTRFAWEKINPLRDEVLGEWKIHENTTLFFDVYLYIDNGEVNPSVSARRNEIFRRELPLALTAMRYGDRNFFWRYPYLDQAPIIVHFMSAYSEFARQENWGNFHGFRTESDTGK